MAALVQHNIGAVIDQHAGHVTSRRKLQVTIGQLTQGYYYFLPFRPHWQHIFQFYIITTNIVDFMYRRYCFTGIIRQLNAVIFNPEWITDNATLLLGVKSALCIIIVSTADLIINLWLYIHYFMFRVVNFLYDPCVYEI